MGAFDNLRRWFGAKPVEIQNQAPIVTGLSFTELMTLIDAGDIAVTPLNAIEAIPVQACVSLISGGITSMPIRVLARKFDNGVMVQEAADQHDYWWLFNEQPNSEMTAAAFWDHIITEKLLRDRAYARIIRKGGGKSSIVKELVPLCYEQVQPVCEWDPTDRVERIARYIVRDGNRTYGVLPEDMLDVRTTGYNPALTYGMSRILCSARRAIGIVLTIEKYCQKFFDNGGMPRTVLSFPAGTAIKEEQLAALREAWAKRYGGPDNAALPLVLQQGGKAEKLSFTAEEAQLLEGRKFQVIDIARAFGVPPFMIGETEKTSAWGSGIEQMSKGFILYTLGPHMTAIRQELNRKLFLTSRYFVEYDEESLARGDMKALGDWFRQAVGGSQGPGILTTNEVRRRLKEPPIEGGDELYTPTKAAPTTAAADPADPADPAEPAEPGAPDSTDSNGDSNASGSQSSDGANRAQPLDRAPVRNSRRKRRGNDLPL